MYVLVGIKIYMQNTLVDCLSKQGKIVKEALVKDTNFGVAHVYDKRILKDHFYSYM